MEVDEKEFKIGVTLRRDPVSAWGGTMDLLIEVWLSSPTHFHGLMNMWLVGAPHQVLLTSSMFQEGK